MKNGWWWNSHNQFNNRSQSLWKNGEMVWRINGVMVEWLNGQMVNSLLINVDKVKPQGKQLFTINESTYLSLHKFHQIWYHNMAFETLEALHLHTGCHLFSLWSIIRILQIFYF